MKRLITSLSTILGIIISSQGQTVLENFNYSGQYLTVNTSTGWTNNPNSDCSPELYQSSKLRTKAQCSFGSNYAIKTYPLNIGIDDTTEIVFTGSLNGTGSFLASLFVGIYDPTNTQNFEYGLQMGNGQNKIYTQGSYGLNSFNHLGSSLTTNTTYYIKAQIIWSKNTLTNKYGKVKFYYLDPSLKDPIWNQDNTIGEVTLAFNDPTSFTKVTVYMVKGSTGNPYAELDDIYFDNKKSTILTSLDKSTTEITQFHPNPFENTINFSKVENWKLLTIHGSEIQSGSGIVINTENLCPGSYILKLTDMTFKVLKK